MKIPHLSRQRTPESVYGVVVPEWPGVSREALFGRYGMSLRARNALVQTTTEGERPCSAGIRGIHMYHRYSGELPSAQPAMLGPAAMDKHRLTVAARFRNSGTGVAIVGGEVVGQSDLDDAKGRLLHCPCR